MSAPQWSATDDDTSDLLTLVADVDHPSVDHEWHTYLAALATIAETNAGVIRPNALRPLVRGHVAPRRIGALANRALKLGLVVYSGEWEVSDDTEGRNGGKPARVMRWVGASA